MKAAIFAFTRTGCTTAQRVQSSLPEAEIHLYAPPRIAVPPFLPICQPPKMCYGAEFAWADAMIFVGACGIAVRAIAPFVQDKRTDPAVLCMDEQAKFIVPLLSGHIGGANDLSRRLAQSLQAQPVLTTATDVNRKFSVDDWAARNGLVISDMQAAKAISAAILEREIPLHSEFPICGTLPSGVVLADNGALGITISYHTIEPFAQTLRLIPRILHLGIGCRRNTPEQAIRQAVDTVLAQNQIDRRAIVRAASIDLKANELGLLQFAQPWQLDFYSAEELARVEGTFTPSKFVESVTGVDNVCERAALLGADTLIVKKTAICGVTVALAAENWEVHFEETADCRHRAGKL